MPLVGASKKSSSSQVPLSKLLDYKTGKLVWPLVVVFYVPNIFVSLYTCYINDTKIETCQFTVLWPIRYYIRNGFCRPNLFLLVEFYCVQSQHSITDLKQWTYNNVSSGFYMYFIPIWKTAFWCIYLAISASFILTEPFFSYSVTVLEWVFVILMLIKATYIYYS